MAAGYYDAAAAERGILKLDESCISNPKAEIANWTAGSTGVGQSNLRFWFSDLKCRIRPISKFPFRLSIGTHYNQPARLKAPYIRTQSVIVMDRTKG